jgi:hypothetical protein
VHSAREKHGTDDTEGDAGELGRKAIRAVDRDYLLRPGDVAGLSAGGCSQNSLNRQVCGHK